MAPVIWGLNLAEIQWYKFGHKYMFAGTYHMQTTRMIVYQLAMIFMVVSESVGTAALSDYVDQQDGIENRASRHTENNDIIAVFAFNIFVGIAVATVFGAGFFFDLFFPERVESPGVHLAWKLSAIAVSILALADAIAITVVVATGNAYIYNVDKATNNALFAENGPPNPVYRHNAYCVASCVLCWVGMISTFAATYVLFRSHAHDAKFGPFSRDGKTNSTTVHGALGEKASNGAMPMTQGHSAYAPQTYQPSTIEQIDPEHTNIHPPSHRHPVAGI